LLDHLENVRLETMTAVKDGGIDWQAADSLYRQVVRDAGLDTETLSVEEVAERLGRSTVAVEVAAVLDHWGAIRRRLGGADDSKGKRFLRVACPLDQDTWRTRLREAVANGLRDGKVVRFP
jgi:hypothetical protein